MSDAVTKEDLREAKDDLRREFSAQIGGVRDAFTEKFDGLKWRLIVGFGGNIVAVIAGYVLKTGPENAARPVVHAAEAIGRAIGV